MLYLNRAAECLSEHLNVIEKTWKHLFTSSHISLTERISCLTSLKKVLRRKFDKFIYPLFTRQNELWFREQDVSGSPFVLDFSVKYLQLAPTIRVIYRKLSTEHTLTKIRSMELEILIESRPWLAQETPRNSKCCVWHLRLSQSSNTDFFTALPEVSFR